MTQPNTRQIIGYREQSTASGSYDNRGFLLSKNPEGSVDLLTHGPAPVAVTWKKEVVDSVQPNQKMIFQYGNVWYHFKGSEFLEAIA